MNIKITRRCLIRIISFSLALLAVLTIALWDNTSKRQKYERQIHNGYVRNMEELSTYLNNITVALYKGIYAGTPYQLSGLSSKLWRDAGSAKSSLAQLPLSQEATENTVKFL